MKGGMIFQHECEHGDFLGSICLVEMFNNLSLFFVFMSLCLSGGFTKLHLQPEGPGVTWVHKC